MQASNEFFCKIFIDTDDPKATVISFLAESINGNIEMWSVSNDIFTLGLVRSDDFDDLKRGSISDGFLFSRYYIEIEPNSNVDSESYIASVSLLLESLWIKGFKAIAACDFEELLPRKGGYNFGLI